MTVGIVIAFLVAVLGWVLLSRSLGRRSVTAPIVLSLAGLLAARTITGEQVDVDSEVSRTLIEITLAVVLFHDASSIALRFFRMEGRYPARLLGIGLPLTMILGTLVAVWLFPGTDVWVLAVVATALAPTDAALGQSIIDDPRISLRLRQVINVESGLNDGLATPVVSFCIAVAAAQLEGIGEHPVAQALVSIAVGILLGFALGRAGGWVLRRAITRGWAETEIAPVLPLVLAAATYVLVTVLGGNGFVGAFVCGVGFGSVSDRAHEKTLLGFTSRTAQLLGYAVWFLFGAGVLAGIDLGDVPRALLYAVLSLTVLRMVPVALSAIGTRLPWDTVALAGWLGPRGLASIVFAILAADELGGEDARFVLQVVGVTVGLSVLAHGLSAGPLASWYSRRHPVTPEPAPTGSAPGVD